MPSIDSLLAVARAYGASLGLDLSTVSWRALGDTKKLPALAAGKDIQVRRFEKAMAWFSTNWPPDAVWPEGVERPHPQSIPSTEQVAS